MPETPDGGWLQDDSELARFLPTKKELEEEEKIKAEEKKRKEDLEKQR